MGELDDALARVDAEMAGEEPARAQRAADTDARRARFVGLVEDFLARMNPAGNPGAFQHAHTKAWSISYDPTAEKPKAMLLTVDGMMPYSEQTAQRRLFGGM